MMKMTRKMAAMVAAMMAVTSIGAVNAFAEIIDRPADNDLEPNRSGNVSVELKANVTETTDYVPNPIQAVWNINVDTSSLLWNITVTDSGTYDIVWNPETQSYVRGTPSGVKSAVITDASATKYIRVTNKSNFDISSNTSISFDESALDGSSVAENQVFDVQNITNLPGRGDNNANVGNIGITLTENGLTIFKEGFAGPEGGEVRVANANIFFTKEPNAVYTYNQQEP
ncbi:MAG: hypothetical protein IIZ09_10370 [Ruminococcus sp.]|nr:hypothetical protein [Ruminococcus sp.]